MRALTIGLMFFYSFAALAGNPPSSDNCRSGFINEVDLVRAFNVFHGIAEGDQPAFRSMVWNGPSEEPLELIRVAEQTFWLLFDMPNFSIQRVPALWEVEAVLVLRTLEGPKKHEFKRDSLSSLFSLLQSAKETKSTLEFLRLDIIDDQGRFVTVTFADTKEEPETLEYTLLIEYPLRVNLSLANHLTRLHSQREVKTVDLSAAEKFAAALNRTP